MDDEDIKNQLSVDASAVDLCTNCGAKFARFLQIRVCSKCNSYLPEKPNKSPWANFENPRQTTLKPQTTLMEAPTAAPPPPTKLKELPTVETSSRLTTALKLQLSEEDERSAREEARRTIERYERYKRYGFADLDTDTPRPPIWKPHASLESDLYVLAMKQLREPDYSSIPKDSLIMISCLIFGLVVSQVIALAALVQSLPKP